MSGYLVNDEICIEKISHHVSPRSSSGDSYDFNPLANLTLDVVQEFLGHFYGSALGGDVFFVDDFAFFIYQHIFGSCRPYINAQIYLALTVKNSFLNLIGTLKKGFLQF